ncbi:MAG: UDP-glucuronic acid decarboxylase family protein [Patescibacteria group bacterium]
MQVAMVAGGAGFIGSHLCRQLLTKGYKVICVDNLLTGSPQNIQKLQEDKNFTFLNHDITCCLPEDLQPDFIFHLASPASPNEKSKISYLTFPVATMMANTKGTLELLQLAKKCGAKFLFASTSEVYGEPLEHPQNEEYRGNVSTIGPRSVYDESKRFGETLTSYFWRKEGVDARIIRIFNTYGPYMQKEDGRVVSNFITQALEDKSLTIYGDGSQTRSFCYVSDMVEGIMRTMFSDNTKGEVINLGNPSEKTVLELAHFVKELVDSGSEIAHEDLPMDDPTQRNPDITKAKRLLDWAPTVSIEEGIKKTIEYFKSLQA